MAFSSFSEFVAMGGYGFFVWLSFGVTALAMAGIVLESKYTSRHLIKQIALEQARKERIKAAHKRTRQEEK